MQPTRPNDAARQRGTYDFIIVGAGSAGCVLADRLSSDGKSSVLLIEAGDARRNPLYRLPMLAGALNRRPANNWAYHTAPQRELFGREIWLPRGKLVGGSFMFNGALYIRGHASDYDHWRQLGNIGWSYDEVLPYFKKSETYEGNDSEFHGKNGPLYVGTKSEVSHLATIFVDAAHQAGHKRNDDFNGASQSGFGRYHHNIKNGRRHSTSAAFLSRALGRANLKLLPKAQVRRVELDKGRAVSVLIDRGAGLERYSARREIILSAGSINTPHLLLLSGIGPGHHLREYGIEVVCDIPGVGQNLQDHFTVTVGHECTAPISLVQTLRIDRFMIAATRAMLFGTGPVSMSPIHSGGFFHTREELPAPDVQVAFYPILGSGPSTPPPSLFKPWEVRADSFAAGVWKNRPDSRGELRLASADPHVKPAIDPRYLSVDSDVDVTLSAVREIRKIFSQRAFDPYRGKELAPGAEFSTDDELVDAIRSTGASAYHTCGTAKMGTDVMAVVDHELCVRGIRGLRIVDASVMPTVPSGNTNAPTIMIAEKASDMILKGSAGSTVAGAQQILAS